VALERKIASGEQRGGPDDRSTGVAGRWIIAAVVIAVVAFFLFRTPNDPAPLGPGEGSAEPSAAGRPPPPPPGKELGPQSGFRVGAGTKAKSDADAGVDDEPDLEPFAAELGHAAVLVNGFGVGVRRDVDGAPVAEVALLGPRAAKGKLVKLGPARGDMDPPLVRRRGDGWVAALLEPQASALALRLVTLSDGKLSWGAEIEQGRDESLAHDMAFNDEVGVIVWDDVSDDGKRGRVLKATVKADTLELADEASTFSAKDVDAEAPRVVPKPHGFWLAYVVRGGSSTPKLKDDDDDGRFSAEQIQTSFIELLPLDANGKADGSARAVTPRDGHVLAFDIQSGQDGGAIIAWRDDDTPTGAQGGRVTVMLVTAGGGDQQQPVAEGDVGAGVPGLLGGWLALPDRGARLRLAPMGADGQLLGKLRVEPLAGRGQALAARNNELLIARPDGRAVDLVVIGCARAPASP
jgi:hypothetical protein